MLHLAELGRAGSPAEITGPLVVGRIRAVEQLPNHKKPVRYAQVDTGDEHVRGIVCAATNVVEGDLVVVALPGTSFGSGLTIEARKTYGRLSKGMMCSPRPFHHPGLTCGFRVPGRPGRPISHRHFS
jgi:phenylalanyl-tRNA synthetase beta chain